MSITPNIILKSSSLNTTFIIWVFFCKIQYSFKLIMRNCCWRKQPHLVHERVSLHGHLRGRMPRLLQQCFELQRNLPGKRGPHPVFRRIAGLRGLLGEREPSHAWTTVF